MAAWVSPIGLAPKSGTFDGDLKLLPDLGVVFCDWLSVTFSPSESLAWLDAYIASVGGLSVGDGKYTIAGAGFIRHQVAKRWQVLSFSGVALMAIRSFGLFGELARLISSHPYKITRLDAALDLSVDAAPVVTRLWKRYKSKPLKLNVWNSLVSKVILGTRFDGVISGTFYAGDRRSAKITARVYDKQHEVFCRTKMDIGSRIRYELTVKTDQVTLRDACDPSLVFWHYMSPSFLSVPSGVAAWVAGNPYVWEGGKMPSLSLEDRLYRVVYGAGDLNAAMVLCGDSSEAYEYLLKLVRLRIQSKASRLPGWVAAYE